EIGPFSEGDAIDFILQYTKENDPKTAARVALQLDYLPTSLEKAAQFVLQKNIPLKHYFEVWDDFLESNATYLKVRSNLPPRNRNFVGREMALVALEETFEDSSIVVVSPTLKIAAEAGMGGIGKTQIALQYSYRNGNRYPYLTWWLNCETLTTLS